ACAAAGDGGRCIVCGRSGFHEGRGRGTSRRRPGARRNRLSAAAPFLPRPVPVPSLTDGALYDTFKAKLGFPKPARQEIRPARTRNPQAALEGCPMAGVELRDVRKAFGSVAAVDGI